MNWGKSIVLSFIVFASFIGILAYKMAIAKVDLVQADYYQKEIDYQKQIDRLKNVKALKTGMSLTYSANNQLLKIEFPTKVVAGEVNFFRTSDKELDLKVHVASKPIFEYSTKKLEKGTWKIQTIWSDGTREYFVEKEIII